MQENEAARLQALSSYEILDTTPEQEFDDIVRLATRLCKAPVALVSLVGGDRQWFKAKVGFDHDETPLDHSVCQHAFGSSDLLVIPDLTLDARTSANPLVTHAPFIRFYAGAPLVTPEGDALGTICVIDHEPRPDGLTEDQAEDLRALARQTMELLASRRLSIRSDSLVQSLRTAQRASTNDQLRLTAMFEQAPSFMALLRGPDHVFELINPAYAHLIGHRDVIGRPIAEALPDAAAQGFTEILDSVYQSGNSFASKGALYTVQPVPDGPGDEHYLDFVYQPIRNADGDISGIFVEGSDVTERVRQSKRLAALAEVGERLRDLTDVQAIGEAAARCIAEVLRASRTGFGRVDLSDETIDVPPEWCAAGIASIAGKHRFRAFGSYIEDLRLGRTVAISDVTIDPRTADQADALLDLQSRALLNLPITEQGRLDLVVFVHQNEVREWSDDDLNFVRQVGDRVHSAIARVTADRQQHVLNQELSHRLKNTLAMVQAIATQTLRHVPERVAVDAFTQRIGALSRAHDVLLHQSWLAANVRDVAAAVLSTFDRPERFELIGPSFQIGPRATLSLSLLLHELATNAIKYGSVSVPEGHVKLEWNVDDTGAEKIFVLTWREIDGPPASEPTGRGFGSRLIRMGLIGTGGVELRYNQSGLVARMCASLSQMQQS